jgi:hypothetical protein
MHASKGGLGERSRRQSVMTHPSALGERSLRQVSDTRVNVCVARVNVCVARVLDASCVTRHT